MKTKASFSFAILEMKHRQGSSAGRGHPLGQTLSLRAWEKRKVESGKLKSKRKSPRIFTNSTNKGQKGMSYPQILRIRTDYQSFWGLVPAIGESEKLKAES